MANLFSSMPLHGAHFVENPAGLRVKRVARAIEHSPALAAKWKAGPRAFLHDRAAMADAIVAAQEWQQGSAKAIRSIKAKIARQVGGRGPQFDAAVRDALAAAGIQTSARTGLKITSAGRRALAAAMGSEQAFLNSTMRQKSRYLDVISKATGKEIYGSGTRMRIKDFRLKNKPTKGKSWKGELAKSAGYAPLLDEFKLRAPGAGSRNAEKNALIMTQRAEGGKAWWNDAARMAAYSDARGGVRASNKARAAAHSTKGLTGRALADAMLARASSADIDRAYRSLGLVALAPGVKTQRRAAAEAAKLAAGYVKSRKGRLISPKQQANQARFKEMIAQGKKIKAAANPFRGRLAGLALSNPYTQTGLAPLDMASNVVSRIPVVGDALSGFVAPIAMTGAAFATLFYVVPMLEDYLPEQAQVAAYSIGGLAVGGAGLLAGRYIPAGTARTAINLVSGAAVATGVAIDLYRRFGGGNLSGLALSGADGDGMGDLALSGNVGGLALSGLALGEAPSALGDGGAYQVSSLGNSSDYSALSSMYADSCMADAQYSGPDLDTREGQAALGGASAFTSAFGTPPRRASGPRKLESPHAGRLGHRWGWLIKLVGFQQFQHIAALPPQERVQVIRQLREQAMASVKQMVEESRAAQMQAASSPVDNRGATAGYDLSGYGATLFAGGAY